MRLKNRTAVVSASSILALVFAWLLSGANTLSFLLFGIATATTATLLLSVYTAVRGIDSVRSFPFGYPMRAHILLHSVPFSYLIAQFFQKPTLFLNFLYLFPIMLFFWTGRQTWEILRKRFGSPMYTLFFRGNTGMLISLPVLLALGEAYQQNFGGEIYRRLLLIYSAVHFFLIGIAVPKIERDVSAAP
jgi:hypothetical protein